MRIKFQNIQSLWYIKSQKAAQTYISVITSHTAGERLNSLPHRSTILKLPCFWYHLIWLCSCIHRLLLVEIHIVPNRGKKKHSGFQSTPKLCQDCNSIPKLNLSDPSIPKERSGEKRGRRKGLYNANIWEIFASSHSLRCQECVQLGCGHIQLEAFRLSD